MMRLIIYLVVVLGAAWLLSWWVDNPGMVTIVWGDREVNTSFAILVLGVAALLAIGLLLQKLYVWAKREMPIVGENRHLRRQERGLEALNKAIVALAAGDGVNARKLAGVASKLLPPQPMMHVVAAQAAKLAGDTKTARKEFEGLMADPDGAFLGVRGLLVAAVAEGKGREARRLAEKAREINPKSAWAIKTLFDLQVEATDWEEARETLLAGKRSKAFGKEDVKKLQATLYYCQAKEAELGNDQTAAIKLVRQALRLKKDFLPAVIMAARLERVEGKKARADKTLRAAWGLTPHPDIAESYLRAGPGEAPDMRYQSALKLARKNPDQTDALLLLAAEAITAKKYTEARKHLDKALEQTTRAQAFVLREALEEARGSSEKIIGEWAEKAEHGTPGPLWKCSNCGAGARQWALHCPRCRMFNTLDWHTGGEDAVYAGEEDARDFLVMLPDPLKVKSAYAKRPPSKPGKK